MKSISGILIVVAVLGASAEQFNTNSHPYGSCLPMINAHVRTSVLENPTINFPRFALPNTVSQTCHCFNTLVRPQFQNEVITVPSVDRIVRTVANPVVETIDCGGATRLTMFTQDSSGKNSRSGSGSDTQNQNGNLSFSSRPAIFTIQTSEGSNPFSNGERIKFQIRK